MEKEVRMNKGSENGSIHHHLDHRGRRHIHQKNIFLPMFCRLSIKDVRPNQTKDQSDVPKPATISSTVQLKRNKTVTGFPTTAASVSRTPTSNNLQSHRRSMKKCASSESLVPEATTITTCTTKSAVGVSSGSGGSGGNRCRRPGSGDKSLHDHEDGNQGCVKAVTGRMSEMDPPLPVVKRVALPGAGGDEVNVWKRRFNGVALKSLEIEHQISPTQCSSIINQTL